MIHDGLDNIRVVAKIRYIYICAYLYIYVYIYGSGHEYAAVLLPDFAINW